MATIRAVPRSRSTSQAVTIFEDPAEREEQVPVHDIHLDTPPGDGGLSEAIKMAEKPEDNHVGDMVRGFEQLASPEHDAALVAEYDADGVSDEDEHEQEEEEEEEEGDDDDEEDPFESSEMTDDGLDVRHSIEHDTPFRHERFRGRPAPVVSRVSNHGYDRSFSTTTAIHLDDHVSPQLEPEEGEEEDPFAASENWRYTQEHEDCRDYSKAAALRERERDISETWSALPEELPSYYKSPLPGRSMLYSHTRSPLSASRSHLATPPSPSPLANRERLLSSPTKSSDRYLVTPTRHSQAHSMHHLQQQDDQRPYSATGRPVFRNPSSVRRMQMSSPPPFSPTSPPRAARHRREQSEVLQGSRHGSPFPQLPQNGSAPGTPLRHPNPKKDYPLVLLHCTLSPLPSTFAFSPAVLEQVLPPAKLRDVALLKERLGAGGATVLERGVLIPHPGDDYELLEERVLESLELRRPRVGGCGHFNPLVDADIDGALPSSLAGMSGRDGEQHEHQAQDADCRCADCGSHVDHAILPGAKAERRWDVRVYAANGLMRSGAWSAAWREMEKVDVEVGVWLDDALRRALDGASVAEEADDAQQRGTGQLLDLLPPAPMPPSAFDAGLATSMATARAGSPARSRVQRRSRSATTADTYERTPLPLQMLLYNYIARIIAENRGLGLAIAVLLAGVWLAFSGSGSGTIGNSVASLAETKTSTAVDMATARATATHTVFETLAGSSMLHGTTETETTTLTATTTTTLTERLAAALPTGMSGLESYGAADEDHVHVHVSRACTFAMEDAEVYGDMTALPRELAARVLGAVPAAATTLPVDAEVAGEYDGDIDAEADSGMLENGEQIDATSAAEIVVLEG